MLTFFNAPFSFKITPGLKNLVHNKTVLEKRWFSEKFTNLGKKSI